MAKILCDKCGKECIPDGNTTGYGTTRDGRKHCFACCAIEDKATMDRDGKIALYLTIQLNFAVPSIVCGKVTNWPGTLSFPCKGKRGHHNMAGARYDVWFNDHNGNPWYGVQYGDNTQICRCRKVSKKK